MLKQADILTLHCALTETTKNLINQETLSLCKKGAYLINTGRGPLIDEKAVCDALKSGQLGGAALDVLVKEPPEKNNPLIELAKTMPNLIITPHIAWASDSAVTTLTKKVAQNIEDFVQQLNQNNEFTYFFIRRPTILACKKRRSFWATCLYWQLWHRTGCDGIDYCAFCHEWIRRLSKTAGAFGHSACDCCQEAPIPAEKPLENTPHFVQKPCRLIRRMLCFKQQRRECRTSDWYSVFSDDPLLEGFDP